jgi:hypothetical protein
LFSRRKRMMDALNQDIRDYIEREGPSAASQGPSESTPAIVMTCQVTLDPLADVDAQLRSSYCGGIAGSAGLCRDLPS